MLMKDEGKLVIWPAYIDKERSRSEGRIVSKKRSISDPDLKEIEKAAAKLGLNPQVQPEKSYPKAWWENSGRVLVEKKSPKTDTVRQIAQTIKGMRKE